MSFDLREYAERKRYQVRDLADGHLLLPLRHRLPPKYPPSAQPEWAIIGRYGYATAEGNGFGWALLCPTRPSFNPRIKTLRAIPGLAVIQEGDTEAAGTAPAGVIESVLKVLGIHRRGSAAWAETPGFEFDTQPGLPRAHRRSQPQASFCHASGPAKSDSGTLRRRSRRLCGQGRFSGRARRPGGGLSGG